MFDVAENPRQSSILDNVEEVEPMQEEIDAMNAYRSGNPEFQPFVSQQDLIKELGL